jgi:dipeptidase
MFGCEMGANEHGVAIGNEAVFTREPERETGLLGMDMMRLALERGKTATQALEIIIALLERYGQGGVCGFEDRKMKYHNSFIIADLNDAWVLETADRFWIAEKVKNVRTISNCLTIESQYDRLHPGLIAHAVEKGYCSSKSDFNFRKSFTAGILDKRTWGGKGRQRHAYTTRALEENRSKIDVSLMTRILRSHNLKRPTAAESWDPSKGGMDAICIHAKPISVPTQTTSSYVGHLLPELQTHWFTGTSAPCTSLFKPVFMQGGLPDLGPVLGGVYDPRSLWWSHERVHRQILSDYASRMQIIKVNQKEFEAKYFARVSQALMDVKSGRLTSERASVLRHVTQEAFDEARKLESKWLASFSELPTRESRGFLHKRYWKAMSTRAKIPT